METESGCLCRAWEEGKETRVQGVYFQFYKTAVFWGLAAQLTKTLHPCKMHALM